MVAALGLKYDSDQALSIIETVMHTKMKAELDCTIDLAVIREPFTGWSNDLEWNIKRYDDGGIDYLSGKNNFYQNLIENHYNQAKRMMKWGRRNVSWSTVAPTGSVSILTQTTSGLEPLFAPYYMRRKKVNPGENVRVDFTDAQGDTWMEYPILHPKFKEWLIITGVQPINKDETYSKDQLEIWFTKSPWYGSTANDIDWSKRVEIQDIIQRYTTHSIKTCAFT